MKTYKILGYILIAFLLVANLVDKFFIKKEFSKIDTTDRQGAYYIKEELPQFRHVVLKGNRFGNVQFYQRKNQSLIRYGGYIKDKFDWNVKNDTLYIDFNDPIFKKDITNFFDGRNTLKNVIVYYDTIETIDQDHNKSYLNSKNLKSLKIIGKNDSWFHINNSKIGDLDITLDNSWTNFLYAKPTYVENLSVHLENKSDIKLKNLVAKTHKLHASKDSKIKKWGFNEVEE